MHHFFGLPPEYKAILHEEIFSLCYYSNGGFGHSDVYYMPVNLRKFYLDRLVKAKEKEASSHKQPENSPPTKIAKPPSIKR